MKKITGYWTNQSNTKQHFSDSYDIGRKLGEGSTCIVYECTEKSTRTKWAVKLVQKREKQAKIVKAEIGILLKLDHPNIIRLKEVYETPMVAYVVLELVNGGELFERIVDRGNYSEMDAANCSRQILAGIRYLHENDVVHRDLKPENLLYANTRDDALLKIADFGLASVQRPNAHLSTVCGTPGYCAPEILKEMKYTRAVDMWSIGVIIYILLCGYEPFYDKSEANMFSKIVKCHFKFHQEYWKDISENAKDLILQLLVLHPAGRLTASQAFDHAWVQGRTARTITLKGTQMQMKQFNERRKLKAVAQAVMAMKKFSAVAEDVNEMPSGSGLHKPARAASADSL